MGVSIHKVGEEKQHKHMASHTFGISLDTASQTVACSNTWLRLAFPLCLPDFYEFFFRVLQHTVIFITAPYTGPTRPGKVLQFGCFERRCMHTSQMKYTLQGCAYDCAHMLMYA